MKRFLLFLTLCAGALVCAYALAPTHARADTPAIRIGEPKNNCQQFTLCNEQTATGVCTVLPASGDEIVLKTFGMYSALTFFGNQSTGAFSCHIFGNVNGYDAESGDGVQLSTTAITESNEAISLNGGNFGFIWASCSAIGTDVILTVTACPSSR